MSSGALQLESDIEKGIRRKKSIEPLKILYIAAKLESPALVAYFKEAGYIPKDMDELIE